MIETIIIIAIIVMTISLIPITLKIEELIESISKKYEAEIRLNSLIMRYLERELNTMKNEEDNN